MEVKHVRPCTQSETDRQSNPAGPKATRLEPDAARRKDRIAPGDDIPHRDRQSGRDAGDDSDGAQRP